MRCAIVQHFLGFFDSPDQRPPLWTAASR
jgi:hypothetical protein